tara:strand:+ start:383 stop:1195 length:813 start_codon:yes stop_codon:yes gene_type:complete
MSKGAGEAKTVSNVTPWETQVPYLEKGFERAESLYNQAGPNYYPGQTYVDFSPQTSLALGAAELRALKGSPLMAQAQGELLKQAQGQYLSPTSNPFLKGLYDQMAGDVTAGVQSQFTSAGRLGSGANQEVLADSLGKLANQVYAPQYQQERQNMQNVLFQAPGIAESDYNDISKLRAIGAEREALQQNVLADAMNRFQYQQMLPYEKLRNYQAATGGSYGQTSTQIQPLTRNVGAGLLGGALGGAELAGMIPGLGGGMGAGLGAILGGLL